MSRFVQDPLHGRAHGPRLSRHLSPNGRATNGPHEWALIASGRSHANAREGTRLAAHRDRVTDVLKRTVSDSTVLMEGDPAWTVQAFHYPLIALDSGTYSA